jgi:hypothetical protein
MRNLLSKITRTLGVLKNQLFLLVFFNGFLLALLVYFFTEDNYESQIFKALAQQVKQTTPNESIDSIFKSSLNLTYNLEKYRLSVFGNKEIQSVKSDVIRPVTFDLMTGSGACGSYSYVLSRLLNELGVETRFTQMKVGQNWGAHIVVEARNGNKWVVLDPSYNLMFSNGISGFASAKDLKGHWDFYKAQVPAEYDHRYKYEDVRYTNWDKYPVVLSGVKSFITLVKGKTEAEEFSMRNLVLRKFNFLFRITLVFYILLSIYLLSTYIKRFKEIEEFRISLMFAKRVENKNAAISTSQLA